MKRVCFFTPSLSGGGAERQVTILCNLLVEKGYDITVVSFLDEPDTYQLSERVKRIRVSIKGKRFTKYFAFFSLFLKIKTDCIICFQPSEAFRAIPAMFFRPQIKVVVGERNLSTGNLAWFERINYKFFYFRADSIVSNSYAQKKYLYNKYPKLRDKLRVITNYTDITKFSFSHSPQNDIRRIAVFARYTPQKNYERFALAIKELKNKTSQKFVIDWYGKNDMFTIDNKARFESLISKYEICDYIKTHDAVNNVQKLLPLYDAVCLPSLYEGFSNSISEAISCGKVMLVSDVSDNSIMVHNNENGFLFDPYSIELIVDAFLRYFECDSKVIKQMENRSREIALSLFDKDKFVNQYIEIIEA